MLLRQRLLLVAVFVVLVSCTGADAPPEHEDGTAGHGSVPDGEPAWYSQREPMPSCGRFELDEMRLDNAELDDANRCFLDAFEAGDPAELRVAHMTDEGDPIFETYRIIGQGELEMMVDTRQDDYGNMRFYYAVCTELAEPRPHAGPTVRPGDCDYDEQRTFPPSTR